MMRPAMAAALAALLLFAPAALAAQEAPLDLTGKGVRDLYDGRGFSLVLINYWATYCAPCKQEMRDLETLAARFKDRGLLVVGVSLDPPSSAPLVTAMRRSLGVTYPVGYGAEPRFEGREIAVLPTSFLVDAQGRILEELVGRKSLELFAELVGRHLDDGRATAAPPDLGAGRAFYTLRALRLGAGEVEVVLAPGRGYHLNGTGYPPIRIELAQGAAGSVTPALLTAAGVEENREVRWRVSLRGAAPPTRITGTIHVVACNESLCRPVDEPFAVDVRER